MSSRHVTLKVNPPNALPALGVTAVSFKAWKALLVAYLRQDRSMNLFMSDGPYVNWAAQEGGNRRIVALAAADDDAVRLRNRAPPADDADWHRDRELANLLLDRNTQLAKFVILITCLLPAAMTYDIDCMSTSLAWIFSYLEEYYGIKKQGAHFLMLDAVRFKPGDSHANFFIELHQAFADSLRKSGERIRFWNNRVLTEDERMSPTLENTVVMLWLERIDARLPAKVQEIFGHQMTGDVSLRDLQSQIATRILAILRDMDELEANRASVRALHVDYTDPYDDSLEPVLNAVSDRPRGRGGRSQRPAAPPLKQFCRICHAARSPASVFSSHSLMACPRLTSRDADEIRASLAAFSISDGDYQPLDAGADATASLP